MNQKSSKSRKVERENKTLQVQLAYLLEQLNTAGLFFGVGGAAERSFRELELLEFEEEEENSSPIEVDDDVKYNTDLFCQENDEKDYELCSRCDESPFAHLVQLCGHTICTNCQEKQLSNMWSL